LVVGKIYEPTARCQNQNLMLAIWKERPLHLGKLHVKDVESDKEPQVEKHQIDAELFVYWR
jgi:hypothetical protein